MSDKVPCPHCNGKGHTLLNGVYAETLKKLRQLTIGRRAIFSCVVANQHAENYFDCKPTALNNRLRRLEELGFVESSWHGRQRRYRAT